MSCEPGVVTSSYTRPLGLDEPFVKVALQRKACSPDICWRVLVIEWVSSVICSAKSHVTTCRFFFCIMSSTLRSCFIIFKASGLGRTLLEGGVTEEDMLSINVGVFL